MSKFDPQKLNVYYDEDCDMSGPMKGRKYSLSHSDETGDLFLTIGKKFHYADDQTVLAELRCTQCGDIMDVYIQVDNGGGIEATKMRDKIFRRELPLALKAIIYGDRKFLVSNGLLNTCIRVKFQSKYPDYNISEQWGKIGNFYYQG